MLIELSVLFFWDFPFVFTPQGSYSSSLLAIEVDLIIEEPTMFTNDTLDSLHLTELQHVWSQMDDDLSSSL